MMTYLRRWQVANSLYHLERKRESFRWVQEFDLCAYLSGIDMQELNREDTWIDKTRFKLCCWFFGTRNKNELYKEIQEIIGQCKSSEINWIQSRSAPAKISESLTLTTRGREIYPYTHLIGKFFGNYYIKWIFGILATYTITQLFNITPK